MRDWSEGYVQGIDYIHAFYRDLSPALIGFALLLNGYRPPAELTGRFHYAELGAGHAGSSALFAAAHPAARFDAVDFNPAHIAGAARVAEEAGLANLGLSEDSFAELAARDGVINEVMYDFVALHGVWSWISAENRSILLDILRRRLKPGGVLFLSYNALPGTLAYMPLRQILMEHTGAAPGPLPRRIEDAVTFAGRAAAIRTGHLAQTDGVIDRIESIKRKTPNYIAHEYLNRDWTAFYAGDVARGLAAAKLSYAGPATPLDGIDDLNLSPEGLSLLQEAPSAEYRETLRDILMNRAFRRDLFVKGAERLNPRERRVLLGAARFALLVPPDDLPETIGAPVGRVDLPQDLYGPIGQALAEAPRSLDELLALPGLDRQGFDAVVRALMVLTSLALAAPVPGPNGYEARRASTDRFNRMVLERNRTGDELRHLASPLLGSGVALSRLECLFLLARRERFDPAVFAWEQLSAEGLALSRDGRRLATAEENIAELRGRDEAFARRRLPVLAALGIA
ncbi:class I SAM-dependent methyltransferase [Azospirillum sp. SYSU D00513]|uniref:class I SAM-dependent methyltransferase n=1 Tax=Azospirillum sp. SYSU D00513 TaxID=2812561 RepID=UPI001A97AF41|nr:class I SAM-dependent methyltransferase [Azospirillum sp. SYSU D00513]